MAHKEQLCLIALFGLLAMNLPPPAESTTPMPTMYFSDVTLTGEDKDPLHDGFNDTVNVSLSVEYENPWEQASYTITCYLNYSSWGYSITGYASGQMASGTALLYIDLSPTELGPTGTYTVTALLAGNDSSRHFSDNISGTIHLYPPGMYRPSLTPDGFGPHTISAGNTTSYLLFLVNSGNCPDSFQLSVSSALGWAVNLSILSAKLVPDGEARLTLNVTSPLAMPQTPSDTETVTVRSAQDPSKCATLEIITKLRPFIGDLSVKYQENTSSCYLGMSTFFSFFVVNNASSADNVTLSSSPLPPGCSIKIFLPNITIPAKAASERLMFSVSISANYSGPSEIPVAVTATSMDGQASASFIAAVRLPPLDLVMAPENISFSNDHPSAGETITINATVFNRGQVNVENLRVRFLNDSNVIETGAIERLPAGMAREVSAEWTVAPGTSIIRLVIDPFNDIAEMNRSNNAAERQITALVPDLKVTPPDIKLTDNALSAGSQTTISVTVHNPGAGNATHITVELLCDDVSVGTQNISAIAGKGGTGTAKFTWPCTEGSHEFTVRVNGDNTTPETTKDNNVAVKQLSVGKGGGGGGFIPGFPAWILLAVVLALVLSRYTIAKRRS